MHIESGAEALQMSCDTLIGSVRQANRLIQRLRMIRAKRTHFRVGNERFGAMFFKNDRSTVITLSSHIYGTLSSHISGMITTWQKKIQAMERLH